MNFFSKIFGDSDSHGDNKDTHENPVNWLALTKSEQLDSISQESFEKPVFVFKHSTRCNISRMVLKQFERHYSLTSDEVSSYFLDLLEYRPISNEIAARFDVVHQSPQLIVLKDGKCIYTASHSDIDAEELKSKLAHIRKN